MKLFLVIWYGAIISTTSCSMCMHEFVQYIEHTMHSKSPLKYLVNICMTSYPFCDIFHALESPCFPLQDESTYSTFYSQLEGRQSKE
jgi:hypothetical protein